MDKIIIMWVAVAIIALVVDLVTSTFLFVWFSIGALAAVILGLFKFSFLSQVIVFALVSIILMIVCYPMVKKSIKLSIRPTLIREKTYLGKIIILDKDGLEKQSVKIDGVYWKIKNMEEELKEGDSVRVLGLEGNKIIIEKI